MNELLEQISALIEAYEEENQCVLGVELIDMRDAEHAWVYNGESFNLEDAHECEG